MRIDSPKMTNAEATGSFKGSFSGSFFGDIQADSVAFENITNVPNGIISGSASDARAQLGVIIGTDVQGYADNLNDIAGLNASDGSFIVGNGSAFVAESGATVRTSLGLGTFAEISSLAYGDLTDIPAGILSSSSDVDFNSINGNPFTDAASTVSVSKNLVPGDSSVTLGTISQPFQDLYLSSASLYIDGQQVISSTTSELIITTDENQSLKLVETGADTITLQTANGDITLTATGNGVIELDAPIQIAAGNQLLSSDGNAIQIGEDISVSGNITVTGTVDGRDVAVDGTKLDGIEAGATADQTAAEIKSAYESNADTNAFTDAEQTKLAGIQTGAEVNVVTSVASKTGDVTLVKADVGLANVDNTSDLSKPISTATQTALDGKVGTSSAQALSSAENALTLVGNTLTLTRGDASTDTIDLSAYLDEDSRAIASGTLNGATGIVTFTRDDSSTFTLDLSDLLDDTNLVTSVNGRNGVVTTTLADYSITSTAAEINTLDGFTGTVADFNYAKDLRATGVTSTEFDYLDGVTSNIQTQLDAKQASGTYNTIIGTDTDISYSGATVLASVTLTDGVVQAHTSRTLTLADLGYTGASDANNYTHPTYAGDDIDIDTGALTGATVISDLDFNVTTDTAGHVTDANATIATRTLTLADLGYTGATNANYITNNNQLTNGAGYTTYSANQTLDNSSNVHFEGLMVGQTTGATANTIRCVGDIVAYYSSDAQFKDNVQQLEGALDKVKQIRGVSFDWNDKQDVYEGHDIGVIAQEVEAVYPELVHERDYNNSKAVDYVKLTAVLIEAVKELSAKVDELEKKCNC